MEKLRYDLYYIKRFSLCFNMTIVLRHRQGRAVSQGGGRVTDGSGGKDAAWGHVPGGQLRTVARNVTTRYFAIAAETALFGLVMLPFNLAHLGPAEYGLWVLLGFDYRAISRRWSSATAAVS